MACLIGPFSGIKKIINFIAQPEILLKDFTNTWIMASENVNWQVTFHLQWYKVQKKQVIVKPWIQKSETNNIFGAWFTIWETQTDGWLLPLRNDAFEWL